MDPVNERREGWDNFKRKGKIPIPGPYLMSFSLFEDLPLFHPNAILILIRPG
jgi:hypothetical protein